MIMTVGEYFEKYKIGLRTKNAAEKTMGAIFDGFRADTEKMIAQRSATTLKAVAAIVREQNTRWNALRRLFEKRHDNIGNVFLPIRDGFKIEYLRVMPELEPYL